MIGAAARVPVVTRLALQVCLLLNLFGTTVAYAVASGNLAHMGVEALWGHTGFWGSAPVLTVVLCGLIALPIGLQRSMSSLRFSSLMGIACSLLLVTVVVTKYFVYCARGEVVCFWNGLSTKYLLPESSHDVRACCMLPAAAARILTAAPCFARACVSTCTRCH